LLPIAICTHLQNEGNGEEKNNIPSRMSSQQLARRTKRRTKPYGEEKERKKKRK